MHPSLKTRVTLLTVILTFSLLSCRTLTGLPRQAPQANNATISPTVEVQIQPQAPAQPDSQILPTIPDLVSLEDTLVNLYESVNPGVVAIRVLTQGGGGLGSGFVIDHEGHIITNFHVIEGHTDLEVDFPSGFKTRGEVVGIDTDSDLAVIKANAPVEELFPLKLGDSSQIRVGQMVVAIGNPFGLSGTMTVGIVSAQGRTLDSMRAAPGGGLFTAGDILQTDTAINPGNSGGPLVNLNGEVIGVNRAIRTFNFTDALQPEPLNSGVGFAIAINIVKRVAPALINDGHYDYPYLGISSLSEISLIEQEALNLPRFTGAYVTTVTPGGPAEAAGLRGGTQETSIPRLLAGGDLIIAIDGQEVLQFSDLLSYLLNYKSPEDTVVLTILRGDEEIEVDLTLGKRPDS